VVNLTADTPARARETADWGHRHRIGYLDGAIMTPTTTIGTPDALFLHSGPAEGYRRHRPVLDRLGGTHTHLGEDVGVRHRSARRLLDRDGRLRARTGRADGLSRVAEFLLRR
jgi:3-hydroxyisobutyrate dehydrogenase-like beta-hydroxyacid dehydrogenase